MTSTQGTFHSCGDGNYATTITCSGSTCAKIESLPGMTCTNTSSTLISCTNNVACSGMSNVTSSFSMMQNGLQIFQVHNISIGAQTYTLANFGSNLTSFTSTNTTKSAKSAGISLQHKSNPKLLILFAFLLFAAQAFAQDSNSSLGLVNTQFGDGFGALLPALETALCKGTDAQDAAITAMTDCLTLLTAAEQDLDSALTELAGGEAAAAGGDFIGAILPILDAEILLLAALADVLVCLLLVFTIFEAPLLLGVTPADVCNGDVIPVISAAPTAVPTAAATTAAISLPSGLTAAYSTGTFTGSYNPGPTPIINTGLPPGWPSTATIEGGSCISCLLNEYLWDIQDECYGCGDNSSWTANAFELVADVFGNDPAYKQLSNYFCNSQCEVYSRAVLIASMGTAYDPKGPGKILCNDQCTTVSQETYDCPGYPPQPDCNCGTGKWCCFSPSDQACQSSAELG